MFSYLFKVSRPRFWIYILGPYLIGSIITYKNTPFDLLQNPEFWLWFIYFLLPANFLIYGVNDLADQDTDEFNDKKNNYEVKFQKNKLSIFIAIFIATNLPMFFLVNNQNSFLALSLFYFFGIFYSLKPIRAKSKPVIDSIFNILYVFPGIFAYLNFSDLELNDLNLYLITASTFWCMAMHTFSAIPDIEADQKANLKTTAVLLGEKKSLIYCGSLYLMAGIIAFLLVSWIFAFVTCLYLAAVIFSYKNPDKLFSTYKIMPKLNMLVGFILFWYIVLL